MFSYYWRIVPLININRITSRKPAVIIFQYDKLYLTQTKQKTAIFLLCLLRLALSHAAATLISVNSTTHSRKQSTKPHSLFPPFVPVSLHFLPGGRDDLQTVVASRRYVFIVVSVSNHPSPACHHSASELQAEGLLLLGLLFRCCDYSRFFHVKSISSTWKRFSGLLWSTQIMTFVCTPPPARSDTLSGVLQSRRATSHPLSMLRLRPRLLLFAFQLPRSIWKLSVKFVSADPLPNEIKTLR